MKKIIITAITIALSINAVSATAATNSLNTKNNKNSCKFIKTEYKSETMFNWINNNATDSEVLKEINQNITMLSKREKLTNGTIKNAVKGWITAEQNTKTALQDKNLDKAIQAMELKLSSVTTFDKLCKSIKA